jgi:predicted esterase
MVLGYSNGANIGWSLLLREPGPLAGAILLRSMLPFDPRPLPDLSGIPVLLIAAHDDELIPVERAGRWRPCLARPAPTSPTRSCAPVTT